MLRECLADFTLKNDEFCRKLTNPCPSAAAMRGYSCLEQSGLDTTQMAQLGRLKHQITRFLRDERGSPTVEFVIMFPFLISIFVMMVGFSMMLLRQNMIMHEMNRITRAYSVGAIATLAQAELNMDAFISQITMASYQSTTSEAILVEDGDIVELSISVRLEVLVPVVGLASLFADLSDYSMNLKAYHHVESH
jgi:hypothetical protein